jgi:hypothetical protein
VRLPRHPVVAALDVRPEQLEKNVQLTGAGLLKGLSNLKDRAMMLS